jgi:glycolate oxidase FAD binding subunit
MMPSISSPHRPHSLADLRDAMRTAAGAGQRLAIRGTGTAESWGGVLKGVDAVIDMADLQGVIAYNPTDLTVAVQAGLKLSALQSMLAVNRQWVALDPARDGTIGGLLATADAGPSRHAFGSLRDAAIGVTVVLADGTVATAGGHVIKNVAGYDLTKLFHGSLGTLGAVAEVVLRLRPLPSASASLTIECTSAAAVELTGQIISAALEPTAAEWSEGRFLVRFLGTSRGVRERCDTVRALALSNGLAMVDDDADWPAVAAVARGAAGDTVLQLGTLPSLGPQIIASAYRAASTQSVEAAVTSSLAAGVHRVRLRGGVAAGHAEVVSALRAEVVKTGGSTTVCRWADGVPDLIPAWGKPTAAVSLMRAVKHNFDPECRLGCGRFAPWF